MSAFFVVQFAAFVLSLFLLTRWANRLLCWWLPWLEPLYLPRLTWGWLAYYAAYLAARWLDAPAPALQALYSGVALSVPLLAAVAFLVRRGVAQAQPQPETVVVDRGTLLIAAAFVAAMVVVGPYFEFPSDAVEYLYRVQAWEKVLSMSYSGYSQASTRFASFAEHWFLRPSGISWGDRAGLGLLSAVLQGLLLWQIMRVATLLTGRAAWGWLAGTLSLGYFGYHAISFYRYVVLSGPLVSFIAYLEGLALLLAAFRGQDWRYFLMLPPVMAFCLGNHEQGVLFLLNASAGVGTLLLVFRYRNLTATFRRALVALLAATLAVGVLIVAVLPGYAWVPPYVVELGTVFGWTMYYHSFQILHEMIGIVGWGTMLLALGVLLLNRAGWSLDVMAALALWPLVLLWNPAALEVLIRLMPAEPLHRPFYGSVYWVLPVVCLSHLCARAGESGSPLSRRRALAHGIAAVTLVGLIALSWIPGPPIYGRMRHVWHRVDPRLDGTNLRGLIRYVRVHAQQDCADPSPDPQFRPIRRYVLSDSYVNAYLLATGYFYAVSNRWDGHGYESPPIGITVALDDRITYPEFLSTIRRTPVCYVILYRQTAPLWSWLGATTGHWPPQRARTEPYYSPRLVEWVTRSPGDFALVFEDGPIRVYRPRP